MTEVYERAKFWKNLSKRKPWSDGDGLNLLSIRNNHGLKKNVDRMPEQQAE